MQETHHSITFPCHSLPFHFMLTDFPTADVNFSVKWIEVVKFDNDIRCVMPLAWLKFSSGHSSL
jgi:hypothetical protein